MANVSSHPVASVSSDGLVGGRLYGDRNAGWRSFPAAIDGRFLRPAGVFRADGPTVEQIFYGISVHALTGIFVSILFARLWWSAQSDRLASPRNFAIVVGAFYWVLVVYGQIGKQNMINIPLYLSLETLIVILTYGSFAYVLRLLFGERARDGNSHQVQP